jgi:aspartyl-tRNA(Asn)/glutamyl-tRNA(Gln) amidotransferase subunit C
MAEHSRRAIDVQKIAALARLTLEPDEAARFAPQLENVLAAIAQLNELDTSKVEPTSHVVPLAAPLRTDEVHPGLPRDEALAAAPRAAEGAFVVPKFVEGG